MTPLSTDCLNSQLSGSSLSSFKVFPDWLSISFPSSCSPLVEVLDLFGQTGDYETIPRGKDKTLYRWSSGTLMLTHTDSYHNFSISGGLLDSVRNRVLNSELITLLRSRPHNITRLDVALDLPNPGYLTLANIRKNHPTGKCDIVGHSRNITYVVSQDPFNPGRETGTAYFQSKSYRGYVKLRVYDKVNELYATSEDPRSLKPVFLDGRFCTRYEFSICKGASLDDYARPDNVFWHYMPDSVLKRPQTLSVMPWSPCDRVGYDDAETLPQTDYERLRSILEHSVTLRLLVQNASKVNGGLSLLHRIIDSQHTDDDFA